MHLKSFRPGLVLLVATAGCSSGGAGSQGQPAEAVGTVVQALGTVSILDDGGFYRLVNRASSQVLDVSGGSQNENANVQQWTWGGGQNQQWRFRSIAEGVHQIYARHSQKCLTIAGGSTADGAATQQATCNAGLSQQAFRVEEIGDGFYRLIAQHSGKCVEDPNGSTSTGTGYVQNPCSGSRAQQFQLEKVDQDFSVGGHFKLIARHSSKALDVAGASTANGAQVQQWTSGAGENQQFAFTANGDGTFRIAARHSNKCLDVEASSTANGAKVKQWDCHTGNNQRFRLTPTQNGAYKIVAAHSNKCLDVAGFSQTDGDQLTQWDCGNGTDQQFLLVRQPAAPSVVTASDRMEIKNDRVFVKMYKSGKLEIGKNGRPPFVMERVADDLVPVNDPVTPARPSGPWGNNLCLTEISQPQSALRCSANGPMDNNGNALQGSLAAEGGTCVYTDYNNLRIGTANSETSTIGFRWKACLRAGSEEVTVTIEVGNEGVTHTLDRIGFPFAPALSAGGRGYAVVPTQEGYILPAGWVVHRQYQQFDGGTLLFDAHSGQSRDWSLPFYGVVEEDGRGLYVEVASENSADAVLQVRHRQGGAPRVNAAFLSSLGTFTNGGVRRMTYVPLEAASYVTMAKRYRASLQAKGQFTSLAQKVARNADVNRLIGGAMLRDNSAVYRNKTGDRTYRVQSSFANTEALLRAAAAQAEFPVNRGPLHLGGWGRRGYDNLHPDVIRPSGCTTIAECGPNSALGGYAGLRTLNNYASGSAGWLLELHDNYFDFFLDAESYATSSGDAVVTRDGTRAQHDSGLYPEGPWDGGLSQFLCSARAMTYLRRNYDLLLTQAIDPGSVYLDVFSATVPMECFNSGFRTSRSQTLNNWNALFDELRARGQVVASEEPVAWAMSRLDHVHWQSHQLEYSQRKIDEDQIFPYSFGWNGTTGVPVPLVQLVFHDSVVMPWSLADGEPGHLDLDAWVAGAPPFANLQQLQSRVVRRELTRQMALHTLLAQQALEDHRFTGDTFSQEESLFGGALVTRVNRSLGTVSGSGLSGDLNADRTPRPRHPLSITQATAAQNVDCVDVNFTLRTHSDDLSGEPPQNIFLHVMTSGSAPQIVANGDLAAAPATNTWTTATRYAVTRRLCPLSGGQFPNGNYLIVTGLYQGDSRLPIVGNMPGDSLVVGWLNVANNVITFRTNTRGEANLKLARRSGSNTVETITEWRTERSLPAGQVVFFHLMDAANNIVANADYWPSLPTDQWLPMLRRRERRQTFTVPTAEGTRSYRMVTGLYDPTTGARFPFDRTGVWSCFDLGTLNVTSAGGNVERVSFAPNPQGTGCP